MRAREPGTTTPWARALVRASSPMLALAAVLLFGSVSSGLADRPTHAEWTRTSMGACAYRASLYYRRAHVLPASLAQLPPRRARRDILRDDWGHALLYRKDGETAFTLTSLGADGRVGGTGDDADLEERYAIDPATGHLVERAP